MTLLINGTAGPDPAPAGTYDATVTGYEDVGPQEGDYGEYLGLKIYVELEIENPETGRPFRAEWYGNQSIHPGASLRDKIIEGVLGRSLTPVEESRGIDLEMIVGKEWSRTIPVITELLTGFGEQRAGMDYHPSYSVPT